MIIPWGHQHRWVGSASPMPRAGTVWRRPCSGCCWCVPCWRWSGWIQGRAQVENPWGKKGEDIWKHVDFIGWLGCNWCNDDLYWYVLWHFSFGQTQHNLGFKRVQWKFICRNTLELEWFVFAHGQEGFPVHFPEQQNYGTASAGHRDWTSSGARHFEMFKTPQNWRAQWKRNTGCARQARPSLMRHAFGSQDFNVGNPCYAFWWDATEAMSWIRERGSKNAAPNMSESFQRIRSGTVNPKSTPKIIINGSYKLLAEQLARLREAMAQSLLELKYLGCMAGPVGLTSNRSSLKSALPEHHNASIYIIYLYISYINNLAR